MKRFFRGLRNLARRQRLEAELDAEVRAYLDSVTEEKMAAGMSAETARREAWMELGGREQVKEAVRDARFGVWLEDLGKDFAQGARLLRKSPGFTAIAVLTLALGIGPNIAMFSFINGILLRPLPYPEPQRLVQIFHTNPQFKEGGDSLPVSPATYADWRSQSKTMESLAAVAMTTHVLTGGEPERVSAAAVSAGFFTTLGVNPALGQPFTQEMEKPGAAPQVILSYGVWQRRLGGRAQVVGELLPVSDKPHTIAGVMPKGFDFPEGTDIWVPLSFEPGEMKERMSLYLDVYGRLQAGSGVREADAEISTITRRVLADFPTEKGFSSRVAPLHGETVREVRPTLTLLFAAVGMVLLVACVNVANLLLARGTARGRDLAVRAALGAGRLRLLQQLLSEGLLLALAGAALGLVLAGWSLDLLRGISPVSVPRLANVKLDAWVLAFSVGLSLFTTLLFGAIPSWNATRANLCESLKEGGRSLVGGRRGSLRGVLVVAEVCLALVLLSGAGLMLRTLWKTLSVNPGFDARNVLAADLYLSRGKHPDDAARARFAHNVLERVRALPGVESAGLTTHLPLAGGQMTYGFLLEGQTDETLGNRMPGTKGDPQTTNLRFVSPGYFETLRIPVLRGRGLHESDVAGAAEVVVINQAMAEKYWPGQDAIGRRMRIARGSKPAWREVVGVVGDIRHASLRQPPAVEAYVPWEQQSMSVFRLAVRTAGDPGDWASALRQAVWAEDKDQPVTRIRPLRAVVLGSVAETRFFGILFSVFAALGLLLSAFGIYCVMAHSVTQRTQEMGIRMALGANPRQVRQLVFGQGLRLAVAGVVLGIAGALYATRWVEKLLYGVQSTDPATFFGTAAILLATAAAACYLPARRATQVDPLVALRHD